jgi:lipid-binding SYLF domain-containing protein
MVQKSLAIVAISAVLLLASATVGVAGARPTPSLKDAEKESQKAAKVFEEIMRAPDKAIPKNVLDRAECVAVFPDVIKAAFVVGGQGGHGVVSCRTDQGWSPPVFLNLGGGSIGFQIGAQSTDFVLLFMNKQGIDSLLKDKFELGAEGSVAAGPVGRTASASTDLKLNAQVLSYSRSKGLFAGVNLKGNVIKPDTDRIRDAYGESVSAKDILMGQRVQASAALNAFPNTLMRYSPRKEE